MRNSIAILTLSLILASCAGKDKPVPRRDAYPRVETYPASYAAADSVPLRFEINTEALANTKLAAEGAVWLNVAYPRYDAEILCTFTPVDASTVEGVIDNRTERMNLNLGGATPAFKEYMSKGGFRATVAIALGAISTPVQFIAVEDTCPRWVVTGAIYFRNAASISSIDSIAPMVAVMERDLTHALQKLDYLP